MHTEIVSSQRNRMQSLEEPIRHDLHEIPLEVEDLLNDLPEPQRKAIRAFLMGISIQGSSWQSPLPPPEILRGYNEAASDGAERILRMTEIQSAHRQSLEKATISYQVRESERGQLFAFIIAMSFLVASVILVLMGHDISGTIIGTVDIVALVSVFIYGKYFQNKEKRDD